jgi:hypothetical protein
MRTFLRILQNGNKGCQSKPVGRSLSDIVVGARGAHRAFVEKLYKLLPSLSKWPSLAAIFAREPAEDELVCGGIKDARISGNSNFSLTRRPSQLRQPHSDSSSLSLSFFLFLSLSFSLLRRPGGLGRAALSSRKSEAYDKLKGGDRFPIISLRVVRLLGFSGRKARTTRNRSDKPAMSDATSFSSFGPCHLGETRMIADETWSSFDPRNGT